MPNSGDGFERDAHVKRHTYEFLFIEVDGIPLDSGSAQVWKPLDAGVSAEIVASQMHLGSSQHTTFRGYPAVLAKGSSPQDRAEFRLEVFRAPNGALYGFVVRTQHGVDATLREYEDSFQLTPK